MTKRKESFETTPASYPATKQSIRAFSRSDFAAMLAVIGFTFALLLSKWAGAAETTEPVRKGQTVKCSIVYINGDAVITCPKSLTVRGGK